METEMWQFHFYRMKDTLQTLAYGNTDCGVFKRGGTKFERFLPKNQHTQTKLLNLRIGLMGRCQKVP